MGGEGLKKRLGILIVVSILVLGVMCGVIIELSKGDMDNEVKESPLVGFLAFEYDEVGYYGSLYYQTFTGEKTLITDHVLGKDRNYFILDETRRLVFYKDENSALYMAEIGKEPKQIVASIDKIGIVESKSGRYLFCLTYNEEGFISYVIIDKEERVIHEVVTGLSSEQLAPNFSEIIFEEESLMFCYVDKEKNLYCSTAYEAPQLIAEKVRDYVSQAKGIILYAASNQEEGSYTFLNGPMKGEQLKAEYISEFLVENIEGEAVAFFRGGQEYGERLYMHRKGEESIVLAAGNVRNFEYISKTNRLYYLLSEGGLMCVDISTVEDDAAGKGKELAAEMDSFSISPNGNLVIGRKNPRGGENELYLITEKGVTLLATNTKNSQIFNTYVIYEGENNQGYVKSIVNNEVVEETVLQYLASGGYWSGDYRVTPQGTYVTYFESKEGRTRLMLYTEEQGIQTLIENVDDYNKIKINNQLYEGALKYGQVVGYYANEDFDILIEMTKDGEMIIYNEGEEKGRVAFKVTEVKGDEKGLIRLSPLSGIDFTIDIFKNRFWNDEVFLSPNTIFRKPYYEDESKLILVDKELTLTNLDEVAFRKQLAGQMNTNKESEEQFLTSSEAVLFTKWYINYRGEEMPAYIEVDHEEGDYYVVHAYDNIATLNWYQVDKRSGEIMPLEVEVDLNEREHKNIMTYKIENEVLWMVDEQGNKGYLTNLDAFYKRDHIRIKETGEFLWQYGSNVYFAIRRYDTIDEYNQDTLWRYDLVQRKATQLIEAESTFDRGVSFILEAERGAIRVEYCAFRHNLSRVRIDPITGEYQEWIAQYHYDDDSECSIAKEGALVYEVVCPKGKGDFFICEYNEETKQHRLLCKVDDIDYYGGKLPQAAIKVDDDIYFMDYTHYLTPEEVKQKQEETFEGAYCKVNVKTAQVSRVSKETYESLLENQE